MGMKLLVVDFDFFFKVVERVEDERFPGESSFYDFGHSEEDPIFYERIWAMRAASFLMHDHPLPRCDEDAMRRFWGRFMFAPRTSLYYADSNMYAFHERIRRDVDEVWLWDQHHDAGYTPDAAPRLVRSREVTCENWMLAYSAQDVSVHMRYPAWRHYGMEIEPVPTVPLDRKVDDGEVPPLVFNRVFVCKSPAWVPSWNDDQWVSFLRRAPFDRKRPIDGSKLQRAFDLDEARLLAEESKAFRERAMVEGGRA